MKKLAEKEYEIFGVDEFPSLNSIAMKLGWGLVLLGWLYSLLIANGSEIARLSLFPLIACIGAFICFLGTGIHAPNLVWIIVSVGLYFLGRAYCSPVWDEAQRDVLLLTGALFCFFSASLVFRYSWARISFLCVVVAGLGINVVVSLYQFFGDEYYAFLRVKRSDVQGVSGVFFHRNYYAGFIEIVVPILFGLMLSKRKWFCGGGVALVGVLCALLSNSRGGFVALILGLVISLFCFYARVHKSYFRANWFWLVVAFLLMSGLFLVIGFLGLREIIESRIGGDEAIFFKQFQARLGMAGIGMEIFISNWFFGAGAEAFSYLFPRFSSGLLGPWFDDARMVHNEYVQVACDYGALGLIGFFVSGSVCVWVFLRKKEMFFLPVWIYVGAVGALVAEMSRALMDFNLHIAPNLSLLAFIVGGCFASRFEKKKTVFGRILLLMMILVISVPLATTSFSNLSSLKAWTRYEIERIKGSGNEVEFLRQYCQLNPEFRFLRNLARFSTREALNNKKDSDLREIAIRDLRQVILRNPFDGESLSNLARLLDDRGDFEIAEDLHFRAIQSVGAREHKYGVFLSYARHLGKIGLDRFHSRRPAEALAYLEESLKIANYSFERNFRRKEQGIPYRKWLENQIEFMKLARIEAADVTFRKSLKELTQQVAYPTFIWEKEELLPDSLNEIR